MNAKDMQPAGFWRRAAALGIDALVLGAAGFLLGFTVSRAWAGTFGEDWQSLDRLQVLLFFGAGLLLWLYSAGFESGLEGATPGKRVMGLAVVGANGAPVSFWRASGRFAVKLFSAAILGVGFLMAAMTRQKQALHDLAAVTYVVRGSAGLAPAPEAGGSNPPER